MPSTVVQTVHCPRRTPAGRRLVLAVAALLLAGCQVGTGPKFDPRAKSVPGGMNASGIFTNAVIGQLKPEWLQPSRDPYRLGPGDHIELELIGHTGTRSSTFVCPDGKIYYDLLPGIDVWGLSLDEARQLLTTQLAQYYVRPEVSLSLTRVVSKRVWVLGRLNRSGLFPLVGPMTLLEAIARAGGLFTSRFNGTTEELADLNHSFIIRHGEMLPVNFKKLLRQGDTSQNIYLEPDDFIYLPSSLSSEIFVLGAVTGPRPVGFMDDMTLTSAIGKALGPQPGAQLTHVAIVRGSLTEPKIAIVNYNAIMKGRAPDVRLQARDIVYVPFSPYSTIERYGKLITDTFVRTVAADEGGHSVQKGFSGVQITSPLSR